MTKLILHFDINETLIASDQSNGKDVMDGILNSISEEVYMKDYNISYKKYTESLYPGLDPQMKEQRLRMLREDLHLHMNEEQKEKVSKCIEKSKHPIVPAFQYLIEKLDQRQIKYVIHLRTFGEDLPKVLPHIESIIRRKIHVIERNNLSKESLRNIFRTQCCAMREDYIIWKNSDKHYSCGKMFPIETSNTYKAFFFDDNITKGIVCPYEEDIIDPSSLTDKYLFNVSILEAYLDDTYFYKKIEQYL